MSSSPPKRSSGWMTEEKTRSKQPRSNGLRPSAVESTSSATMAICPGTQLLDCLGGHVCGFAPKAIGPWTRTRRRKISNFFRFSGDRLLRKKRSGLRVDEQALRRPDLLNGQKSQSTAIPDMSFARPDMGSWLHSKSLRLQTGDMLTTSNSDLTIQPELTCHTRARRGLAGFFSREAELLAVRDVAWEVTARHIICQAVVSVRPQNPGLSDKVWRRGQHIASKGCTIFSARNQKALTSGYPALSRHRPLRKSEADLV